MLEQLFSYQFRTTNQFPETQNNVNMCNIIACQLQEPCITNQHVSCTKGCFLMIKQWMTFHRYLHVCIHVVRVSSTSDSIPLLTLSAFHNICMWFWHSSNYMWKVTRELLPTPTHMPLCLKCYIESRGCTNKIFCINFGPEHIVLERDVCSVKSECHRQGDSAVENLPGRELVRYVSIYFQSGHSHFNFVFLGFPPRFIEL